jgi:hypothetical protein
LDASSSTKGRAWTALIGLLSYLALGIFSAFSYPGGTFWDPSTVGFGWTNFWCDLLRPIAHSGLSNEAGAWAARLSLLALALALGPFFALARTRLELKGGQGMLLETGAWGGRIALILVAAGTGRLPAAVHDWAILLGAPSGLVALALVIVWSARLDRRLPLVGGAGLALALWNLAEYAREALLQAPDWRGLPVVQKAATLLVSAFCALFTLAALRTASEPAHEELSGNPSD